jgi:hypothetical protein
MADNAMNALDRALDLVQKGEHEQALNLATALLEAASQSPGVAFVVGQALAGLGADSSASDAFQLAAEGATLSGNLPLVLAACCEIGRLGGSSSMQLERAAVRIGRATVPAIPGDPRRSPR